MAELAPVFMTLRASIGEFKSKMGEAEREVTKLERKGSGSFSKLAAVGKGALLGIGGAAITIGAASLKLADTFEKSHAQLQNAIKRSGSTMQEFKKPVDAVDKAMEKFGFTNAQTEEALAHLTTATNNPKKALDQMGLAANIARARNIDLATASDLVAKVMAGNLRPLKAFGIDLPIAAGGALKLQKAQEALAKASANLASVQAGAGSAAAAKKIASDAAVLKATEALQAAELKAGPIDKRNAAGKAAVLKAQQALTAVELKAAQNTGSSSAKIAKALQTVHDKQAALAAVSGASASVLDTLNKRFGGAAAANAETFAGKMEALHAKVSDLGKGIGLLLIPVIEKAAGVVLAIVRWLEKHKAVAIALAVVIGGVLLAAIGAFIVGLFTAGGALAFVISPITLVLVAIGALAFVVWHFRGVFIAAFHAVVNFAKRAWHDITVVFQVAWGIIKRLGEILLVVFFGPFILGIKLLHDHWRGAWKGIQDVIHFAWHTVIQPIFNVIMSTVHGIGNVFHTVFNGIGNVVSTVLHAATAVFKGYINFFIRGVNLLIRALDSIQIHIPKIGVGPLHTPAFDWNGLGIPEIPYLEQGGFVPGRGPILSILHGGEFVLSRAMLAGQPASRAPALAGGGGGSPVTLVVPIHIAGREVARATLPYTQSELIRLKRRSGVTGIA